MFSIITPTFNREHTLERVFDSLKNQTTKEFEWIIVDDCSTDKTQQLVENWQKEYPNITIEYYVLPENKGKPFAVNIGVKKAKQPYSIIADSDDAFSYNTLEDLQTLWKSFSEENHDKVAAIWSLVEDEQHKIKGDEFLENPWQVNFKERVLDQKKQLDGDKWHCWRTDVLKQFPLFYDEKCHIGESHTWNAINKAYDFYCINKVFLTVYNSEVSLMNSKKPKSVIARAAYLSSYYGLKDVSISEIITYKYYRYLAFMYIKSFYGYTSKELKLSFSKKMVAYIIFISKLPQALISKLK